MIGPRPDRELLRDLRLAEAAVRRTSARRRDLQPGSSRAKVTTANARWSTACEARDRILTECQRRGLPTERPTNEGNHGND